MKTKGRLRKKKPSKYSILTSNIRPAGIIVISLLAAFFLWMTDSILSYFIYYRKSLGFLKLLITDVPPQELYIRLLIVVLFIVTGILLSLYFSLRIKAEKELINSEQNLRSILHSLGDAVIAVNKNGIIISSNPAAEKLTEFPKNELVGKELSKTLKIKEENHGLKSSDFLSVLLKTNQQCEHTTNTILISKNGKKIPVKVNIAPILDDLKKTDGMVLVLHDETKEQQSKRLIEQKEETLRKSEEKYRLLAETTPDLIILIDSDGTIEYVNKTSIKKSGFMLHELKGKNFMKFIPSEYHEEISKKVERTDRNQ